MSERTIGNYVLGPLLGRGGMSEVYAAEHRFLGDRVAIKLLSTQLAGDPSATAAFVAEATRTRAIDHPNVVRVLDFGSDDDGCYLVMERLEGQTLGARIEGDLPLGEAEVRRLGAAIADGVAAAHERGIVHRDLKPGNIMLAGDVPKIVDFGIARSFDRTGATVTATRIGSLAYMAPEQITEGLIAPSVDIWALGVILYEALAGRLPFDDFANGRIPQLVDQAPRLATLAAVSPRLEALITSCLKRDPARRPASMRELAAQLRDPGEQRLTEELPPLIGRGTQPLIDPTGGGWHDVASGTEPEQRVPALRPRMPSAAQRVLEKPHRGRRVGNVTALGVGLAIAAIWIAVAHRPDAPRPLAVAVRGAPLASAAPETAPLLATATPPSAAPQLATPPLATTPPATTPPATQQAPAARDASTATASAAAAQAAGFVVEVRSAPAGASVRVGGKRVGVTPATIALDVPASIVISRAGYQSSRVRAVRAGPITVRLVPTRRARGPRLPQPVAGETLD